MGTVNTIRPDWHELLNRAKGTVVPCNCGSTLTTVPQLRVHWQLGHFDYTVDDKPEPDKYQIVGNADPTEFAKDIQIEMADDWKPLGGVAIHPNGMYVQAMTRKTNR